MTAHFSTRTMMLASAVALSGLCAPVYAQPARPATPAASASAATTAATTAPVGAGEYIIGPEDVLQIVFWREKEMSAEVAVRPDGKISLPLLNDIEAAGLTPAQLNQRITDNAKRYIEDPNVAVVVKQINSRKVYVIGEVARPGPYPLTGATTVLQMIAMSGGLKEYADAKHIIVMRLENGRTVGYPFNYRDVSNRKNLYQNLELRPGDTIVVP